MLYSQPLSWISWISQPSASYSVLFADHLRICWRAQSSVEFSWWHLCIVKIEHLFLLSAASLFTDYLSLWRPLCYPRATQLLCWDILLKVFWNSMGTISMVSPFYTCSLLYSRARSWEAGFAFSKVEPWLKCQTHVATNLVLKIIYTNLSNIDIRFSDLLFLPNFSVAFSTNQYYFYHLPVC